MNLKRKFLLPLLGALVLVFALAVASACNKHVHTYSDDWKNDSTYHWHAPTCDDTDEVIDKEAHTYKDGVCDVCGYPQPDSTKQVYDMSGITFENLTVVYNGEPQSIQIGGDLPAGVSVSYDGNAKTDAGTYTVTAHFTGDSKNYQAIPDKTATLTIQKADYDMRGITFDGATVTYDGNTHPLAIKGQLPTGVNVSYENNDQTEAGQHEVIAHFSGDKTNFNEIDDKTATLTIEKADYDMRGITFGGATVTYDGNTHPLAIKGQLPTGVNVSYENNNKTTVGRHTVVAHFTGDTKNYNPIPDMEATLIIEQAAVAGITFENKTVTYNGESHSIYIKGNLPEGVSVSYENNGQINAGEYTIKAIFNTGKNYKPLAEMTAKLIIEQATVEGITFAGKAVTYNGETQTLKITGNLPAEVSVRYENNDQVDAGEYQVKAIFDTGKNYKPLAEMTAKLVIEKATYNMKSITFEGLTVTYDGNTHPLAIKGQLPQGVNVSYENNNKTTVGRYTVVAHFTGDTKNHNPIPDKEAKLTIEKRELTVKFTGKPQIKYDRQEHKDYSVEATNLINGDSVTFILSYSGDMIEKGEYTVKATIEEHQNYKLTKNNTLTVVITRETHRVTFRQENQPDQVVEVLDLAGISNEQIPTPADVNGYTVTWQNVDLGCITTDITIMAVKTPITYTIHYYLDEGQNSSDNPQSYDITTPTITLAEPTKNGNTFLGWFKDSLNGNQIREIKQGSMGNLNLYAKWACGTKGLQYTLSEGKQIVSGYTGTDTEVVIPDTWEGVPVTEIAEEAFRGMHIKSISFPQTIISIGNRAFSGCAIESVDFGNNSSLTSIGAYAFSGCTIESITIPDSVTTIDNYAFNFCEIKMATMPTWAIGSIPKSYLQTVILTSGDSIDDNAFKYCTSLVSVDFVNNSSLTFIGKNAFMKCTNLVSITIPKTVTSIGYSAFSYCTSLESIDFGDGSLLASIGSYAFEGCTNLESITIPDSVTTIGNYAFYGCEIKMATMPTWAIDSIPQTNLQTVILTSGDSIGTRAFYSCESLESITIPDSVTTIGKEAFYYGCKIKKAIMPTWAIGSIPKSYLQTVILTSGDSIGKDTFRNCTNLVSITIPKTVTSIGYSAFSDCTSLESITIPDGVTSIGSCAFEYCTSLESVNITDIKAWCEIDFEDFSANPLNNGATLYLNGEPVTDLNDTAGITEIKDYAFYGCTNLESITVPKNVTFIGEKAFFGCTSLTTVYWNATNCEKVGYYLDDFIFSGCTALTTIYIDENVESIPAYAFMSCKNLESVDFGNNSSLTSIGDWAFNNCENLAHVYITDIAAWCMIDFGDSSANPLNNGATLYLNGEPVTDLNDLAGITEIKDYAFYGCTSIINITIPENVTSIGSYAFRNCTSLVSVDFGNNSSLTSIGASAFEGCTNLESVDFGNNSSLTSIGASAFEGCTNLVSVDFGNNSSLTSIGASAFYGCTSLVSVDFGNNSSLTSIGAYAFNGCTNLESITIPKNVTSIGNSAFGGCTSLASVYWNATNCETAESISPSIFDNYAALTTLHIGENVENIPAYAFCNCTSLVSVDFGNNSSLTSIGSYAFRNCTSLVSITIPENVTTISDYAFYNCTSLTTVYWNATNCQTAGSSTYPIFSGCTALTTVHIGENVESIPAYVFRNCTSLVSVDFGNNSSLTSIGYRAYYNCTSLTIITIPENVTSIENSAFGGCTSLTTVYWNATNCHSDSIFSDRTALTTVYIGENVESIPAYAFNGCTNLESITIPENVTSIGSYAFRNCTSLVSITIPENVTTISDYAFYNCTSLATVYWNATNCQTAGSSTYPIFSGCTALTTVHIGENVESIPEYAFYNCTNLKNVYYGSNTTQWKNISIGTFNDKLKNATRYYYSADVPDETKWAESDNWWHYDPDTGEIQIWKKD